MTRWAAELGVQLPDYPILLSAGLALLIVFLTSLAAVVAGKTVGPRLARFWEKHAGARSEGISQRMCDLVRFLVAALILAIALKSDEWPLLSSFILGLPLALATGLLIRSIVRGLQMPRWVALLLAGAAFVAILADASGGLDPITQVMDRIAFNAGRTRISLLGIVEIGITILAIYAVLKLVNRLVGQSIRRATSLDATQQLLAQKITAVVLLIAAFFVGVDMLGIDLTALAVFSGAFGLAVGFGFQKTFGNLIAGIILLMDRSIKPGDVIVVGDSFGRVTKIGVRAVSVVTRDGKEHLIPNENLMTQEVENWSYSNTNVRIHIPVGVSYDCDLQLAQRLMSEAADEPERVLSVPKPNVLLRAFGERSVEHEIRVWVKDPEAGVGNVQSEILNRLWVLFQENGIGIPYPKRDLYVKEWPAWPDTRGHSPSAPAPVVEGEERPAPSTGPA